MKDLDKFYPVSHVIRAACEDGGPATRALLYDMEELLKGAKNGNRDYETALTNLIGQIYRMNTHFGDMQEPVQEAFTKATDFLQSVGRTIGFGMQDPELWISKRGGDPRW